MKNEIASCNKDIQLQFFAKEISYFDFTKSFQIFDANKCRDLIRLRI